MLDFLLHAEKEDAINILKADHDKVKALFDEFADKDRTRSKKAIVAETLKELRIHAAIEEEIFYPAVRPRVEKAIMNEANEEHHVAKVLIAELGVMNGTEEHYDAKFHVLSENIRHHIKEEEGDMFPKVRALDMNMVVLGKKMLARKQDLLTNGIPATTEEKLIAAIGVKLMDSPARTAEERKPAKKAVAANANPKKKPAANGNQKKTAHRTVALRSSTKAVAKKTAGARKAH